MAMAIGHNEGEIDIAVDWKETPYAHLFKAVLPGIAKENVKVEIRDGEVLAIHGVRLAYDRIDVLAANYERKPGSFLRRFSLPLIPRIEVVAAAMENGVLTVAVPKDG